MSKNYDVLIVGGGPGGLSCGQYSARAGRKTAIIEEMAAGGQTMIIDEIENYPGLGKISGYELAAAFEQQATGFGCDFVYATVNSIKRLEDGSFELDTTDGAYLSPVVVIATGAKHRNLEVPGEKEMVGHGVSYCATCDGPFFRNKKILVCGGGDSACQEALYLKKLSDDVTVTHRRDRFRAQASIVKAMEEAGIKTKMNTTVQSINAENGKVKSVTFVNKSSGETYTEEFDGVFIFVGNIPQTQLVPDCEKDEAGFIKTDRNMMTSIPGIYAIGDVRDTPFRQVVTAASDGAIAAHYASEYIDARAGIKY
ncbi:MAG: FAD-dependent oxidoreductase [Spirochaetales bacterium]|nr:FAD-dependent oxidoreductase [Spirochaetales bacterium]MBR6086131.1 FAD-dependent oxidoreductase [Spirochaetales bacterium]